MLLELPGETWTRANLTSPSLSYILYFVRFHIHNLVAGNSSLHTREMSLLAL